MSKSIALKVTMEFVCLNMVSQKTFENEFNSDPMAVYNFISDNQRDGIHNFAEHGKITKIEVYKNK